MSKLDDLIKELCPDGVEYKTLGEIFDTRNGYTPSTKNSDFWKNGTIPWFVMDDIRRNGHVLSESIQHITESAVKKSGLFPANSLIVSTSATIGEHALITEKFLCNQRFTCLSVKEAFKSKIDMKFMFYYAFKLDMFCIKNQTQSTFASVDMNKFYAFMFPIPPLPIQEEIVCILDKFTSLTAELTAELTARRKQYEYYRDALLTRETKVERFKIKDLFDTRNGYTPSTSNSDFWDNGTVPWFVMEDIRENGRVLSDSKQHITESAVKKSGLFPANSIIVATSATIGEHALITSDFLCNQRFTCLSPKTKYKSKIDMKYMFYYAFKLDEFCKRNTTKSSFASVDMGKFYDFEFPLPPLDVQQRIVNVLDNFDSICSDLKIGLPAEIEARKKQYEYYRDLLLTFSSSGNTIFTEQNRTEQNRTEQNRTEQNR